MLKKIIFLCLFYLIAVVSVAVSQTLDGAPYDPEKDAHIDMFLATWKDSMPRHTHGSLIERDILTQGNQLNPPRKGATLEYVKKFAHATLFAGNSTIPVTLKGEQEIFYVISGKGVVQWGDKTAELREDICFLVPENLEFTMKNTGDEPLTMYLICEPVPDGFTPVADIGVRDNKSVPFGTLNGHWSYQEKDLLLKQHGLGILHAVITLTLDPMTIGHPHVHVKGCEEVWTTIRGDNIAWLGKEIRHQPPGTAYMIPPDGKTNHSNINQSKTDQVLMLYFSVRADITQQ
ncbi:MAG: cupin domain-containing protein [Candidatus Latescibacteria bacterium]|nr:cupin domain-containing protein [Candidatus Latescibacterota bacterium]